MFNIVLPLIQVQGQHEHFLTIGGVNFHTVQGLNETCIKSSGTTLHTGVKLRDHITHWAKVEGLFVSFTQKNTYVHDKIWSDLSVNFTAVEPRQSDTGPRLADAVQHMRRELKNLTFRPFVSAQTGNSQLNNLKHYRT